MKKGSAEHIKGWARKTENYKIKQTRYVTVHGCANGNIGDAICEGIHETHYTKGFSMEDYRVGTADLSYKLTDAIIFNNGLNHLDWIEDQPEEEIWNVTQAILTHTMVETSHFVKQTIKMSNVKTIIFIGSMAHNHVLNGSAPYCAAKAGLQMFAKCIAYELAPKGYRVYCINPSNVQDSPMSEATIQGLMRYKNLSRQEAEDYWGAECPMGTFLRKDEIAGVVSFLLTVEARYLSGTAIDLPGAQR